MVLGIETSCDETAVGLVHQGHLLADRTTRQVLHELYGGVVPELASRAHDLLLTPAVKGVMKEAGIGWDEIEAVAVTRGPGLIGALLVGISFAQGLASGIKRPLFGVNHLEAHIWAAELETEVELPMIVLLISGGHTMLVHCERFGRYRVVATTRDDAAGELLDKVGRMLGVPFPAGATLDRWARECPDEGFSFPRLKFSPEAPLFFSFSGIKTAVLYYLKAHYPQGQVHFELPEEDKWRVAKGVMEALTHTLTIPLQRTLAAETVTPYKTIVVVGGVASSLFLRQRLMEMSTDWGVKIVFPSPSLCTDNGAMVAYLGEKILNHYQRVEREKQSQGLSQLDGEQVIRDDRHPSGQMFSTTKRSHLYSLIADPSLFLPSESY